MRLLARTYGKYLIVLCVGVLIGAWWGGDGTSSVRTWKEEREQETIKAYSFISPLLSCDGAELSNTPTGVLRELRESIDVIVTSHRAKGTVNKASVYVRELNDGVWLGINERDEFTPGSLLKVPAVMSLFKYAEEKDASILNREIEFGGGDVGAPQHYPPQEPLTVGQNYSMNDIMRHALIYSDNNAASLIAQSIDTQYLFNAYKDLGLHSPALGQDYLVRVKDYAAFFRTLYNATYVNRNASEFILSTLAQSSFMSGISAGVPRGTVVAHKFGERVLDDSSVQLHDCGIVYTQNPYIICILSQGKTFEGLESFIAEVSKATFIALGT